MTIQGCRICEFILETLNVTELLTESLVCNIIITVSNIEMILSVSKRLTQAPALPSWHFKSSV